MTGEREAPGFLFTAFEPSGDALAAPVIAQLRKRRPHSPIWALGGPKMQRAGAQMIEITTEHAVMLGGGVLGEMGVHMRRLRRLRGWLGRRPLAALVPVDSPAANWPICKAVRKTQPSARIIHLVAPQLWAWGAWRTAKLRRLTDHLLCVLPFEPDWFANRDIIGSFVGHPLFSAEHHAGGGDASRTNPGADPSAGGDWPQGTRRLALLPGSRATENKRNWPLMIELYRQLKASHPGLCAVVAAADNRAASRIAAMPPPHRWPAGVEPGAPPDGDAAGAAPPWWPPTLDMKVGAAPQVLEWCDVAVVVSGTASLLAAAHGKPTVVVYKTPRLVWLLGHLIVHTRTFSLPNLISERQGRGRVLDEFVPHFGQVEPVVAAVGRLLSDPQAYQGQVDALARIRRCYEPIEFAAASADRIEQIVSGAV